MAIITPNKFALLIENTVRNKKVTHWEAVLMYCKDNDIDPTETDPYFDVQDYVESLFRKTNE